MRIRVTTPCRIHLSLIDENGYTGRVDGGIGLMLDRPNVVFEASNSAKEFKIEAHRYYRESIEVINEKASNVFKTFNISNKNFHFNLKQYYPSHVGLGSKTQLSLAIATSIAKLKNLDVSHKTLTKLVGRGGTSGIGWRGFQTGGFILDAGHDFGEGEEKETFLPSSASMNADPALTVFRYNIPENWRFVLIIPNVRKGAFGDEEVSIFQKHTPIPRKEVNEVSHQILMKIIPGLLKNDLTCFGEGLKHIQSIGFKSVEISLQNKIVKDLLNYLDDYGVKAYGMSSFGPSVVGITESEKEAKDLNQNVKTFLKDIGGHFYICRPNNIGAKFEVLD
ncbi:MAG: beta-ribofuranosylaminobenzene 5'-phosphate synthase [Candidatus Lokiarchaeota archaeon]|nr:beta-ribofuranosylaminobenzene 5'-phosphate synthase [Candidatus Lokiarchaeota archaeon]MBD3201644.1 beta-ribofuranosylaminobenzene 5'-phosphate synthase [Candidatus Lokiarchaeota archaeon]